MALKRLTTRILIWITVILMVTLIVAWASLPYLIKQSIIKNYQKRGADKVSVERLDFNLFTGHLDVKGIRFVTDGQKELEIGRARGTIDGWRALKQDIIVQRLDISDVRINIRKLPDGWRTAGIRSWKRRAWLPAWFKRRIRIKQAGIKQLLVNVIDGREIRRLRFRRFSLSGHSLPRFEEQVATMAFSGKLDEAEFRFTGTVDFRQLVPKLGITYRLEQLPLRWLRHWTPKTLAHLSGHAAFQGKADINVKLPPPGAMTFKTLAEISVKHQGQTRFTNVDFRMQKGRYRASGKKLGFTTFDRSVVVLDLLGRTRAIRSSIRFDGTNNNLALHVSKAKIRVTEMAAKGSIDFDTRVKKGRPAIEVNLSARKITSQDLQEKLDLFEINRLSIPVLKLDREKQLVINHVNTSLVKLVHSSTPGKNLVSQFSKRLMAARTVQIRDIHWSAANGISIKNLAIDQAHFWLYREKHLWSLLTAAREAIKQLDVQFPRMQLQRLEFVNKAHIYITDYSFTPFFNLRIDVDKAELLNLDSIQKESASRFTVNATSGHYTKYFLSGHIKPFLPNPELNLSATIQELELPPFNPYNINYYGYQVKAGRLDADVKLQIKNHVLTSTNRLVFSRLDLSHARRPVKDQRFLRIKLPVNLLVKMLADRHKRLTLRFPIRLDLNDPNAKVSLSYFRALDLNARKALGLAISITQPVGRALTLIRTANNVATSLRLKPVLFKPGSSRLGPSGRNVILKTARILSKKRKLSIQLCPRYTKADLDHFKQTENLASIKEQVRLAVRLSGQRAAKIKFRLAKKHKIASGRIFLCKPVFAESDEEESEPKPRVDIRL